MFLAILYKTQILQPAQPAQPAVEEVKDARGRVTQEAKPAVEARDAVTREVVQQMYIETDSTTVAANLANGAHHIEYYRIKHVGEGTPPQMSLVSLCKQREKAPAKEVVQVECEGEVVGRAEI